MKIFSDVPTTSIALPTFSLRDYEPHEGERELYLARDRYLAKKRKERETLKKYLNYLIFNLLARPKG